MTTALQIILIIIIGLCMFVTWPLMIITIRDIKELLKEVDPDEESIHSDMSHDM